MHLGTYQSFTDCYLSLVKNVYESPQFEASPRGQKVKEILGASFTINNPRDRIPYVAGRKFSVTYMVAELLWYLSGNNETKWISRYSSFWNNISDDGVTANSAYGARLLKAHPKIAQGRIDQWSYVINELKNDPDSRRAIMHIRVPDDSIDAKLDVPCTLALQFFIRDGKLHQVANMRSSDVIFGIAYDIPAFTIFQELLANELGVELGTYTHTSNSLHIYERHFKMAENILKTENVSRSLIEMHEVQGAMPKLYCTSRDEMVYWIEKLFECEKDMWNSTTPEAVWKDFSRHFSFPNNESEVWHDWALVLAANKFRKMKSSTDTEEAISKLKFKGYGFNVRSTK